MANYGAKSPLFAPFSGAEPENSDPVYGQGIVIGKLVSCGVTPNNAEGKLAADNGTAEYLSQITDEDIALETDDLILQNAKMMYGAKADGNDMKYTKSDVAPYGGFAFYHTAMRNGVQVHIGHFFPKVRATRNAKTFNTRGDSIEFGTTSIALKALFTNLGDIEFESEPFSTEEAAYAWCAEKVGLGSYYTVDVQVQNETASKYTDFSGKAFVPSGENFELSVTGAPTALYDNGTEKKSSISGGKYTISAIAADHEVAVIF